MFGEKFYVLCLNNKNVFKNWINETVTVKYGCMWNNCLYGVTGNVSFMSDLSSP